MHSLKVKRFIAAFIDLFVLPFVVFLAIGVSLRTTIPLYIPILFNVIWVSIRDIFGGAGPGKRLMHLQVIVCETGEPLSKQTTVLGVLRNIPFMIPVVLWIGYIVETIMLVATGERLGDTWAKTKVVEITSL